MNNQITYRQLVTRLEENNLDYGVLTLQNDVQIVISKIGGRVYGPFLSPDSASINWIPCVFSAPDLFSERLKAGATGLGGERLWLAPEVQFNVRDRTQFGSTYQLPPQIDPGTYTLAQWKPGQWKLEQDMTVEAFNTGSGITELHIETFIQRVDDPLRQISAYRELTEGVTFAGYSQVVTLTEQKPSSILSEAWNILQLNPGGVILIPSSPCVEFTNYYDPAGDLQEIKNNHVRARMTGDRWYKLGYKAAHVTGRLAYFNLLEGDQAYLLVRNFFNNPSALYIDEPGPLPGVRGDSIQIYNDDGGLGGFGEMEVHGGAIGGETGRSSSRDEFTLWFYTGSADSIKRLMPHLLGIEY